MNSYKDKKEIWLKKLKEKFLNLIFNQERFLILSINQTQIIFFFNS